MADWVPVEADFTITGKDAEEPAASPDPGPTSMYALQCCKQKACLTNRDI